MNNLHIDFVIYQIITGKKLEENLNDNVARAIINIYKK